jgi:ribosomal RNA assembly protein
VGVLIGEHGSVKSKIEKTCGVELRVDGETGNVAIYASGEIADPSVLFTVKNIVLAIGRGFSPSRAFKLLDGDMILKTIDLRDYFGKSNSEVQRIKGRIIGRDGKTRGLIENLTKTDVSVYGHTVCIIGDAEKSAIASEAVEMLIRGAQHGTVYKYLHRKRRELKKGELEIWKRPPV